MMVMKSPALIKMRAVFRTSVQDNDRLFVGTLTFVRLYSGVLWNDEYGEKQS